MEGADELARVRVVVRAAHHDLGQLARGVELGERCLLAAHDVARGGGPRRGDLALELAKSLLGLLLLVRTRLALGLELLANGHRDD